MAGWLWALFFLALAVHCGALVSAEYWADHLKKVGSVDKKMPGLHVPFKFIDTHERFYSDLHKHYRSAYIRRCVKVLRVTTPSVLLLAILVTGSTCSNA